jgi:hypothetical protein
VLRDGKLPLFSPCSDPVPDSMLTLITAALSSDPVPICTARTHALLLFEFHEFGSIGKLTVVVVDADSKLLLEIEWIRVPTVAEFRIYKFMMTLKDLCPCACLV